ncbi:MAG: tRNA (adenosine(37)-N6)-threonylcarbamoyltransferase complex ATPase subunit type 1 TsaE [Gammaproteobacteria bacterium]
MRAKSVEWECRLGDEAATATFGRKLAAALPTGAFAIALAGPLGAGKSTLARAMLRGLGVEGPVPSPTYTLVEPYATTRGLAYHVDLYRLQPGANVNELGLEDTAGEGALLFVEWPERGAEGHIAFDLSFSLAYSEQARMLTARALTPAGGEVLNRLQAIA